MQHKHSLLSRKTVFFLALFGFYAISQFTFGQCATNTTAGVSCTPGSAPYYGTLSADAGCGSWKTYANLSPGANYYFNLYSGGCYSVSTCGASIDTQLGIFSPTTGLTTPYSYDDDNGPSCTGTSASVDFIANYSGANTVTLRQYNCRPGGTASVTTYVRQNNNLSITSSSTNMCAGQTRTLTATPTTQPSTISGAGDRGTFSGTGVSGTTFTAPTPAGASQTYTITYTFGYCSTTQNITVYRQPAGSITTPSQTICATSLSIAAVATYGTGVWSTTMPGVTFANANSPSTTVSNLPTGVTSLTWTVSNGPCSNAIYTIDITVNSSSTAPLSILGTNSICLGGSTTLTANGGSPGTGAGLVWYSGSCGGTNVGVGSSISVSPTTTTSYYVRYEGTCNNTSCASTTVTVTSPSTAGLATGDYVWKGTSSASWNTAANWFVYNGTTFNTASVVPTTNDNVFITPTGTCVPNAASTSGGVSNARNITINSGATLDINAGSTLNMNGSWINNSGSPTNVSASPTATFVVLNNATSGRYIGGSTGTTFGIFTTLYTGDNLSINTSTLVGSTLNMSGNITLNADLTLGYFASSPGTLNRTTPYWMTGSAFFRRFFNSTTNSGNASGLFPFGGVPGAYYRGALLEFTTASSGGWIEGRFITTPLTYYTGLPILNDAGVTIQNYMNEGYWELNPGGGLTGGSYSLTLNYDGITTINNPSELRIIKSPDPHTTWVANGTHGAVVGGTGAGTVSRTGMTGFSYFVISSNNNNPLPVELLSFNAVCVNSTVKLQWTTATEVNNQYFSVERSADGVIWSEIGRINGAGNSNVMQQYAYTDEAPVKGASYYRLSQVDYNGDSETFDPVSVSCVINEGLSMLMYPNPASEEVTIAITSDKNYGTVTIRLIDMLGRVQMSRNETVSTGENNFKISGLDMLSSGAYQVQIIAEGLILQPQKLIIR